MGVQEVGMSCLGAKARMVGMVERKEEKGWLLWIKSEQVTEPFHWVREWKVVPIPLHMC
jgi:hypothetical protein